MVHCKKGYSDIPVVSRHFTSQTVWYVISRLGKEMLLTFFYGVCLVMEALKGCPYCLPATLGSWCLFQLLMYSNNRHHLKHNFKLQQWGERNNSFTTIQLYNVFFKTLNTLLPPAQVEQVPVLLHCGQSSEVSYVVLL